MAEEYSERERLEFAMTLLHEAVERRHMAGKYGTKEDYPTAHDHANEMEKAVRLRAQPQEVEVDDTLI